MIGQDKAPAGLERFPGRGLAYPTLMALEDYPFRVEKMGPRGEIGRVLIYADDLTENRARHRQLMSALGPRTWGVHAFCGWV